MGDGPADWRDVATALQAHGVPERRAEVVALKARRGLSHREICDELGIKGPGNVTDYLDAYREQVQNSQWLADNAPIV